MVGGHDVAETPLPKRAEQSPSWRVPSGAAATRHGTLLAADREIRRGRAAVSLAELKLGIRSNMSVVLTDPSCVRRLPDNARDFPLLLCSAPEGARDRYHATEIKEFLLHQRTRRTLRMSS